MLRSTLALSLGLALSACNGNGSTGQALGTDIAVHSPVPIPSESSTPIGTTVPTAVGNTCHPSDSSHYCLGLKYVVYTNASGVPVDSATVAAANITGINQVWAQCQIAFQIDEFVEANPAQYGLTFDTANSSELDTIRQDFDDATHMLVVTTGTWDRTGTLGSTGANAWTNMPGDGIYGSILEAPVGNYPNIIAHELGHYMNLAHVSDQTDLMNPIIYDTSITLTAAQCAAARASLPAYWSAMLR